MPWSLKTKIQQQEDDQEIVTPDGHQILVGVSDDQVLLYREGYNNWSLKARIEP